VSDADDTLVGALEGAADDDEPGAPEERGGQGDELLRARLLDALEVLREVQADRGLLAVLDEPTRRELMIAAGHVSRPDRHEIKKLLKALRKRERASAQRADQALLDQTGIRALRRAAVFPTPPVLPPPPAALAGGGLGSKRIEVGADQARDERAARTNEGGSDTHTQRVRKCYVCKARVPKVHFFYDQLCEAVRGAQLGEAQPDGRSARAGGD
jgi:hypothetical protein